MDILVLWKNFHDFVDRYGYLDAETTYYKFTHNFKVEVNVDEPTLEKLLYCSNLLSERNLFWHPTSKSFDQFLKSHYKWPKFDTKRNYFEEK